LRHGDGTRTTEGFTTLDEFLNEEGSLAETEAVAIKEVIAWQLRQAMAEKKLSQRALAEAMGTSRTQIARLLDPDDGNVTLGTLQRAARVIGRQLRVELI
jgi:DNA-binding Xre family transcriptional regulator